MTLLEALRVLLLDAGIAPVYMAPIPADRERAVAICGPYESEADVELPGLLCQRFQCWIRAGTQGEAEALAQRCFLALADKYPAGTDVETNEAVPLQGPAWLGTDGAGRHEYSFNVGVVCWVK